MTGHAQSTDRLWRTFEADLSLYKFYLELAVKIAALFFALAGGILAYSLANYREDRLVVVALLLPSLLAALLALLSIRGARGAEILRSDHETTWSQLGFAEAPYDLSFLRDILRGLTWIYAVVALIILGLFLWLMTDGQSPRGSGVTKAPNHAAAPGGSAAGDRQGRWIARMRKDAGCDQ